MTASHHDKSDYFDNQTSKHLRFSMSCMWRHAEFLFFMFAKFCAELVSRERIKIYISEMTENNSVYSILLIMKN